jgi:Domain of unknown function (DUF5107)
MTAHVTDEWTYRGLRVLVLSNDELRVVILPELGGKIWQLTDTRSGRDFLWHNPRVRPRQVPFGAVYDDVFFGGWDELFPNDMPEEIGGEAYPDHGELWSSPWEWSAGQSGDDAAVVLTCTAPISGCLVRKEVVLRSGLRAVEVRSRLVNASRHALPYLWKQHVAVPLGQPARLDLPATTVLVEGFGRPRGRAPAGRYRWPGLVDGDGATHDMRLTLPPESDVAEFQYATELESGWCSVTYADGGGLGLAFDAEVFPSCWTFASYGGWRGLEVLILEPCTGYPVSLAEGVAAGTHRTLQPGQTVQTAVIAVPYRGFSAVTAVHPDGTVEGSAR